MTELIRFARWELTCDPQATSHAYRAILRGRPEGCGCKPCLNFVAARDHVYSEEMLSLLQQLGITAGREAEVYHLGRLDSGRHLYGGWVHFVGFIESGKDAFRQTGERSWEPDLEPIDKHLDIGFSSHLALVPSAFAGHPVVQLEFKVRVPWVLDIPEPD